MGVLQIIGALQRYFEANIGHGWIAENIISTVTDSAQLEKKGIDELHDQKFGFRRRARNYRRRRH